MWFGSSANTGNGKCLSHEQIPGNLTCVAGATADFDTKYQVVTAGTLSSLWAETDVTPAAGKSWVVNVRVNGTNSALTCTVAAGALACEATATVAVVAGDQVDVQLNTANGAANHAWKTYVTLTQ